MLFTQQKLTNPQPWIYLNKYQYIYLTLGSYDEACNHNPWMNLPQVSATTTTIWIASHGILWLLACNQLKLLTTHSLGSSPYLTPEVTKLLKNKKNRFRVVVSQDDLRVVVVAAACCCGSPHPPESQERTRTLSLSILLRLSSSSRVFVLRSSPTRESEGPNRPLQEPYKGTRRTQPSSKTGLQGNPKDPSCPLQQPLR